MEADWLNAGFELGTSEGRSRAVFSLEHGVWAGQMNLRYSIPIRCPLLSVYPILLLCPWVR